MHINELIQWWESSAQGTLTEQQFTIRLPVEDVAKLQALNELYPKRPLEGLVTDLLSAALHELEGRLPYQPGKRVVAEDEFGDPMYEDAGPTPRFMALTKKHLNELKGRGPQETH